MAVSEPGCTSVDRETLYAEIWTKPGTQLARKYGVSDVAIGKACRRHDIPRPPPGYWAMRRNGYEVKRPPLPPLKDGQLNRVEFHPQPQPSWLQGASRTADEAEPGRTITIADDVAALHPLVEAARKQLRSANADERRIVSTNPETALAISVASASITRALKIMDALIRAWENAGGSVKLGVKNSDHRFCTGFGLGDDVAPVTLTERTEPVPDWKPPKDYWHRYPPHRPNGQLVFAINYFWREGLRSSWADGKSRKLDAILDQVFDGLMIQVEDRKRRRLDNQCEARQKAAAERRRAQTQKRAHEEKARRESLVTDADKWHQVERIRAFLGAMRAAVAAGKMRVTDEQIYAEWSDWASWYADHVDPLIRAKLRPAALPPPTNKPISELDLTFRCRDVLIQLGIADADSMYKLTEDQILAVEKQRPHWVWSEVCRVLEGLGYNMPKRQ
jgi:hypothetical protein